MCFNDNHSLSDIEQFASNNKLFFLDLFNFTITDELIAIVSQFSNKGISVNITVMADNTNIGSIITSLQPYKNILTDPKSFLKLTIYYYIKNNYQLSTITSDLTGILDFGTLFVGIGIDDSYCFLYDLYQTTNKADVLQLYSGLATWYKSIYAQYPMQKVSTLHYYIRHYVHLTMGYNWDCDIPKCDIYYQHLGHHRINVAANGDFYPCNYVLGDAHYKIGDANLGLNKTIIQSLHDETSYTCDCELKLICLPKCPLSSNLGFDDTFCDMQRTVAPILKELDSYDSGRFD